ncbi:ABC transporter ATP-binding protein [Thermus sp. FJN-A]
MSLSLVGVSVRFGGLRALEGVSLSVGREEVVGLVGPNGAGKTTLLNLISRFLDPSEGEIWWEGENLLRKPPEALAALGIGRTFQIPQLFSGLTVLEHLALGAYARLGGGFVAASLGLPRLRARERDLLVQAEEVLELLGLSEVAQTPAAALPYGMKKRVEMGRALLSRPRLLLLDEPGAGLSQQEKSSFLSLIARIRTRYRTAILLVEHDMELVQAICERVLVLNFGRVLAQGRPEEVLALPEVVEAYLGEPLGGRDGASRG